MAQAGELPPSVAQWAQDYLIAQARGLETLPEMPDEAKQWAQLAHTRAAQDRFTATGSSYLTGLGVYPVNKPEIDLYGASRDYNDVGYDAERNPYGSRAAQQQVIDDNAGLGPYWSRTASIPGMLDSTIPEGVDPKQYTAAAQGEQSMWDGQPQAQRPGIRAATSDYYDMRERMFNDLNAAENQGQDTGPYWDNINDLPNQYPSAGTLPQPLHPWHEPGRGRGGYPSRQDRHPGRQL